MSHSLSRNSGETGDGEDPPDVSAAIRAKIRLILSPKRPSLHRGHRASTVLGRDTSPGSDSRWWSLSLEKLWSTLISLPFILSPSTPEYAPNIYMAPGGETVMRYNI